MAQDYQSQSRLSYIQHWVHQSKDSSAVGDDGLDLLHLAHTRCLDLLNHYASLSHEDEVAGDLGPLRAGSQSRLRNCRAKLFLWGHGLEEECYAQSLETSPDLRKTVIEVLCSIYLIIHDHLCGTSHYDVNALNFDPTSWAEQSRKFIEDGDADSEDESESDNESSSAPGDIVIGGSTPSVQPSKTATLEYLDKIETLLNSLNRVLPSLEMRSAVVADLRVKMLDLPPAEFHTSIHTQYFIDRVLDKYKNIDYRLAQRLGEANWQRFGRLRSMAHSKDQEGDPVVEKNEPDVRTQFHDSGLGSMFSTSRILPKAPDSTASHSSFLSSIAEGDDHGSLKVPPLPETKDGLIRTCSICFETIRVRNRVEWKIHVFEDLQPYICTHSSCPDHLICFPSRKAWEKHVFELHQPDKMRQWSCRVCSKTFCAPEDLSSHRDGECLDQDLSKGREDTLGILTNRKLEEVSCPFCWSVAGSTRRLYSKHICRHMEDVALASLLLDGEGQDDDFSTESSSHEENDTSWGRGKSLEFSEKLALEVGGDEEQPGVFQQKALEEKTRQLVAELEHQKRVLRKIARARELLARFSYEHGNAQSTTSFFPSQDHRELASNQQQTMFLSPIKIDTDQIRKRKPTPQKIFREDEVYVQTRMGEVRCQVEEVQRDQRGNYEYLLRVLGQSEDFDGGKFQPHTKILHLAKEGPFNPYRKN